MIILSHRGAETAEAGSNDPRFETLAAVQAEGCVQAPALQSG